jgi:transposase
MSRTDLSEKQWRQLKSHLPGDPHRGHAYVAHRRVLNGILWRLKTGAPWRDVPARYGPWQTCYDRFVRWSRDGTWQRILHLLQAKADASGQIDWDGAALDATHIKAHRSATGARKKAAQAEKRGP